MNAVRLLHFYIYMNRKNRRIRLDAPVVNRK